MTQCATLVVTGTTIHRGIAVDVISAAIPAYTRTALGFAAIEKMHRAEYTVRTESAGTPFSIADYALWLLKKAADEPFTQEAHDDARS